MSRKQWIVFACIAIFAFIICALLLIGAIYLLYMSDLQDNAVEIYRLATLNAPNLP